MSVTSTTDYKSIHRDRQESFAPVQIIYFCWEGHLLFAAPSAIVGPPDSLLGDLIETQVMNIIKIDPDSSAIDWSNAEWISKGEPISLDLGKSLSENGLRHKQQIILRTPSLNSVCTAA